MKKKILLLTAASAFLCNCTDHDLQNPDRFSLNPQSVAEWKGFLKTGYFNNGTIKVESDDIKVENGKVTGGSFNIPVSSIINLNLPTDEIKEQLVHHLQSPDFFNMALHPNVRYEITDVLPYSATKEGDVVGANYWINGTLTILGRQNPVSFPAKIVLSGNFLSVEANLKFDRTKWGITYASDPDLAPENYIEPMIEVHLQLSASK
ncbi:YceI family protein [Dyadobacter sp. CY345]|uniref:YceI family protein n=1 Tax=Dyadobacter sp. CY345 TaxID=2909335 RepID=UPI001F1E7E41|nr:YceI family protein [Dyadobacter sp. CY345]MCF2446828.1 YceI family protein [Dyadobacter sp. CY345]